MPSHKKAKEIRDAKRQAIKKAQDTVIDTETRFRTQYATLRSDGQVEHAHHTANQKGPRNETGRRDLTAKPPNLHRGTMKCEIVFPDFSDTIIGSLARDDQTRYLLVEVSWNMYHNWPSNIAVKINAIIPSQNDTKSSANPVHHTVHVWTFKIEDGGDLSGIWAYSYPPLSARTHELRYEENLYDRYCREDKMASSCRRRNSLMVAGWEFTPSLAVTQGIHRHSDVRGFEDTSRILSQIFQNSARVKILLFVPAVKDTRFYDKMGAFQYQCELDRLASPLHHFMELHPLPFRVRIGKDLVVPSDQRPATNLDWSPIYSNDEQCWIIEGLSVLESKEISFRKVTLIQFVQCELRVLKTSAGSDREYLGLIRLPLADFPYRFQAEEHFDVKIDNETWSATTLAQPFVLSNPMDINVTLHRPFFKGDGWSKMKLPELDLTILEREDNNNLVVNHCISGPRVPVYLKPFHDDKTDRVKLAAIRELNPGHDGEKGYVGIRRWRDMILGQDLRVKNITDIFEGLDVEATLIAWDMTLNDSQRATIDYLRAIPNHFGIIQGPFGTGKTYVDVVVTMLLMSVGKRVKVLSSANETADDFVLKLNEELKRLEEKNICIASRRAIVRFHATSTERSAVHAEVGKKNATLGFTIDEDDKEGLIPPRQRWTEVKPLSKMFYDHLALQVINKSKERPHGIADRRYRLHQFSLGHLVLKTAGILGDSAAQACCTAATSNRTIRRDITTATEHETTRQADIAPETSGNTSQQADSAARLLSPWAYDAWSDDDDNDSLAQQHDPFVSHREWTTQEFCAYFNNMSSGVAMVKEGNEELNGLQEEISRYIIAEDVAVMIGTLIGSGDKLIQDFKSDHTIIQEAARAQNSEVFVALANQAAGTVHTSGDIVQSGPVVVQEARFSHYDEVSLVKRLSILGYPMTALTDQYRTIAEIGDIISEVWYQGKVKSCVSRYNRPNVHVAISVLKAFCGISQPLAWIDVRSQSVEQGATKSKENEIEASVAVQLAKEYVTTGIAAADIVIISGYAAQVQLLQRVLSQRENLTDVEASTIDKIQGREKAVVIYCLVRSDTLGFQTDPRRLLVACSRSRDSLVIIGNYDSLTTISEQKRHLHVFLHLRKLFERNNAVARYTQKVPSMDIA